MIEKVTIELMPFFLLFLSGLILFGFVFVSLDMEFGEDYEQLVQD